MLMVCSLVMQAVGVSGSRQHHTPCLCLIPTMGAHLQDALGEAAIEYANDVPILACMP